MRIIIPNGGEVEIDSNEKSYKEERENICYVEQDPHIFTENFEDNITCFSAYAKKEILKEVIGEDKYNYLKETNDCSKLSGGEKEMVVIERALNSNKEILVLDEPFAALNSKIEYNLTKLLNIDKNKTVIMVTHNEDGKYLDLFDEIIYF